MSIVKFDSESIIASIVEAMLPRFSDRHLGLYIEMDMGIYSRGTPDQIRFRKPLHFLFVRPSNYTKVFFWEPKPNAVGQECTLFWNKTEVEWHIESDHDSCWRTDGLQKITQTYFNGLDYFRKHNVTDTTDFNTLWREPSYVYLHKCEQKNQQSEPWSDDGRIWIIQFEPIERHRLISLASPDEKIFRHSGLLIKDSDCYVRYQKNCDTYHKHA